MELKYPTELKPFIKALMVHAPSFCVRRIRENSVSGECNILYKGMPINSRWELCRYDAKLPVSLHVRIAGIDCPVLMGEPIDVPRVLEMLNIKPLGVDTLTGKRSSQTWLTRKLLKPRMHKSISIVVNSLDSSRDTVTMTLEDAQALVCSETSFYDMTERAAKYFASAVDGQTLEQTLPGGGKVEWSVAVEAKSGERTLTFSRTQL